MRRSVLLLFCLAFALIAAAQQKDKSKRPSPPAPPAVCTFSDGKTVTIDYSQPAMKGRKIYGELVPFNEPWRTGANEATTFVTTADVKIVNSYGFQKGPATDKEGRAVQNAPEYNGPVVPAGNYTLYTLPGEKQWELILSKKTGQWGIPYPGEQFDLGRYDMKTELIEIPIEKLTISFLQSHKNADVCTLRIDWEKTRAYVDVAEKK
ncbi:MAG TPA: DUF2911 domain-containing protein [Terriglobales bacterium]|nr:DUF2911 domain-containing protein [Terriglobales bacterium]